MSKKKSNISSVEKVEIAQNPIGYTGNVVIKILNASGVKRTIEIKNSGTLRLFQGIGYFLLGADIMSSTIYEYRPSYLGLGNVPVSYPTDPLLTTLYNEYSSIKRLKLEKGNIRIDSKARAIIAPFVALIPYSTVESNNINELGLYSTESGNTLLARIELSEPITILNGESVLVEWQLIINNSSVALA